jgi:hypothetical protein
VFVVLAVIWPDTRHRVEAWLRYRLLDEVPPPIVAGLHGRLFLGNHAGSPPGSLINTVCNTDPAAITAAAEMLRPLLAAAKSHGVPARLLIVPTAPRLYPEDLPPPYTCPAPGADKLVALLDDPDVLNPLDAMTAMKPHFDAIPRVHFHWAGEAPLRVAEWVGANLGLKQTLQLGLHDDNRRSDLDGLNRGMGAHSQIREPSLAAAGVAVCEGGLRCRTSPMPAIATYVRPGPGRILVVADSFGDDIGGDFTEFAGTVWLVRMNIALNDPADRVAKIALQDFKPDEIFVIYHDAGALAVNAAARISLKAATAILAAGQP